MCAAGEICTEKGRRRNPCRRIYYFVVSKPDKKLYGRCSDRANLNLLSFYGKILEFIDLIWARRCSSCRNIPTISINGNNNALGVHRAGSSATSSETRNQTNSSAYVRNKSSEFAIAIPLTNPTCNLLVLWPTINLRHAYQVLKYLNFMDLKLGDLTINNLLLNSRGVRKFGK